MGFSSYIEREIQDFTNVLSAEEIKNLKKIFDEYKLYQDMSADILSKGLNSSADVDYTNDYEKALTKCGKLKSMLDFNINALKEKYNIQSVEENSSLRF